MLVAAARGLTSWFTYLRATSPRKEVNKLELRDFDHAGIAAYGAEQVASTSYEKKVAESLEHLALGLQLLQRQVDRLEARISRD